MAESADDEEKALEKIASGSSNHPSRSTTSTLLPAPIASLVSVATKSSALYLRLGTFIGGLAINGARVATLTGLELSRAVIEGVLTRAGRDVVGRSTGELGRNEAESLLEKSVSRLEYIFDVQY